MLARVLEISDQNIYLEIDNQLRFRSKYILPDLDARPNELSQVDFDSAIVIPNLESGERFSFAQRE